MDEIGLDIYTDKDLQDLLARVNQAFRLTQMKKDVMEDSAIPVGMLLYIEDLKAKIARYREELARRGVLGPAPGKIKILFLTASPGNTTQLSIDEEISRIQQRLRSAKYRDQFELVQEMAVQVTDIPEHLLRHTPTIVHFGGHGNEKSEVIGEDSNRLAKAIPVEALAALFGTLKSSIRCVVLNACYAAAQAKLIATHIECTVGMTAAVQDDAAIVFAENFYSGLAFGRSIKAAFDLACAAVYMQNPGQQGIPSIYASPGVNLESLVLTTAGVRSVV